ncbi:hypothetical protein Tco_0198265, partial [Tanacetum coccineum]
RPSESQPIPSLTHPSEDQPESQLDPSPRPSSSIPIPDSNLEGSGGNHGAAMLKKQQKKKDMEKPKKRRSVSKQGRKAIKSSKGAPSNLDETSNKAMDYTLAQDQGNTDSKVEEPKTNSKTKELHLSGDTLVVEDKGSAEKEGSTKGTYLQQSTVKPDEGTNKQNRGTDRTKVSTDSFVEGTAEI